jgi:hypothetical protein
VATHELRVEDELVALEGCVLGGQDPSRVRVRRSCGLDGKWRHTTTGRRDIFRPLDEGVDLPSQVLTGRRRGGRFESVVKSRWRCGREVGARRTLLIN